MNKDKKTKAFSCSELYWLYYLIKGKRKRFYSFNIENPELNYQFFWALYGMHKDKVINFNKVKLKLDGYYEDSAVKNIADFLKKSLKDGAKKILCGSGQKPFFKLMDKGCRIEEFIDLIENNNKFTALSGHISYDIWDNIIFKVEINEEQWQVLDNFYKFYLDKFIKDEIYFEIKPNEEPRMRYKKQREILLNIVKILLDRFSPKNLDILKLCSNFNYKNLDIFEHLLVLEKQKIIKINDIAISGSGSCLIETDVDIDEKIFKITTKDLKRIVNLREEKREEDTFQKEKIKKLETETRFDSKSGILFFKDREINFINKPNQKDLLITIFKDPKKKWYYDEIQEDWDPKADLLGVYKNNSWKKFYSAGDDINNAIAVEIQIKDFLIKNTKHIQINSKYL